MLQTHWGTLTRNIWTKLSALHLRHSRWKHLRMAVNVLQESSQTCAELHLRCAGWRDYKRIEHTEIMSVDVRSQYWISDSAEILQIQFRFLRTSDWCIISSHHTTSKHIYHRSLNEGVVRCRHRNSWLVRSIAASQAGFNWALLLRSV